MLAETGVIDQTHGSILWEVEMQRVYVHLNIIRDFLQRMYFRWNKCLTMAKELYWLANLKYLNSRVGLTYDLDQLQLQALGV